MIQTQREAVVRDTVQNREANQTTLAAAERAAAALIGELGCQKVYVFGSLTGRGAAPFGPRSDVDLAVEGLASEKYWRAWEVVERELPPGLDFDLVRLEDAVPSLASHVQTTGVSLVGDAAVTFGTIPLEVEDGLSMDVRRAVRAADLENELSELDQLTLELAQLPPADTAAPTTLELRAAGSILHDYYNGAERIFERIATTIDAGLPGGPNWHADLLDRRSHPIPEVRPTVISSDLRQGLGDYLRFRHLFRNFYGSRLRWPLLRPLVDGLPSTHRQFSTDVRGFIAFLRDQTA